MRRLRQFLSGLIVVGLIASQALSGATFSRYHIWAPNETLTANDLNTEFNNIINQLDPVGTGDYSTDVTQMRAATNPYPASIESSATSMAGEIERIRYQLSLIIGKTYWYEAPGSSLPPAGSVIEFPFATAPSGWLFIDGKTIGDASSGATARANADCATLFGLIWDSYANTERAIQDSSGGASTRGATATADFAAHKRLSLGNRNGRMPIGAGQGNTAEGGGAGTSRVLGAQSGAETHIQSGAELAAHTHSYYPMKSVGSGGNITVSGGSDWVGSSGDNTGSSGASNAMPIMNPHEVTKWIIKY